MLAKGNVVVVPSAKSRQNLLEKVLAPTHSLSARRFILGGLDLSSRGLRARCGQRIRFIVVSDSDLIQAT